MNTKIQFFFFKRSIVELLVLWGLAVSILNVPPALAIGRQDNNFLRTANDRILKQYVTATVSRVYESVNSTGLKWKIVAIEKMND